MLVLLVLPRSLSGRVVEQIVEIDGLVQVKLSAYLYGRCDFRLWDVIVWAVSPSLEVAARLAKTLRHPNVVLLAVWTMVRNASLAVSAPGAGIARRPRKRNPACRELGNATRMLGCAPVSVLKALLACWAILTCRPRLPSGRDFQVLNRVPAALGDWPRPLYGYVAPIWHREWIEPPCARAPLDPIQPTEAGLE